MSLTDPLAHLAALRPARKREPIQAQAESLSATGDQLAQLLGAEARRNRYGEHLSLREWYATPEMCRPDPRALSLLLPHGTPTETSLLESVADPEQWLFLDTETTGLAGGTGTYAFLVGLAWWDAGGLQVEQFFMRDLNEEQSLLLELSSRMKERPVLVTFNGKNFDWPLLETRYRMTRAISPRAPLAHLDLLHPARQLWRLQLGSVRLKELEQHVLANNRGGLGWSRGGDIDSAMIPQMYFDYLRGGPAEPLRGVFQHNRMDLRGLAALAGKVLALLGQVNGTEDPHELYGLSRLLSRRGQRGRARECYERALLGGLPRPLQRQAQHELAQLAKRERDYTRATSLWEALRKTPDSIAQRLPRALGLADDSQKALQGAIEAAEQLAIYYEHRAKQPQRAAELTRSAIAELQRAKRRSSIQGMWTRKLEERLLRRLARLERHLHLAYGAGGGVGRAE
jgi:uncharacterized protein YprB with RNaseH-like and TPR domain